MIGYIYKTTNLLNGKIYIGQHKNSDYKPKYLGSGKLIKAAINKYGIENFSNEIICSCETKEDMCNKEIYWINKYQSFPKTGIGYNLTPGGEWGDITFGMNEKQYSEYCKKFQGNKNGMFGHHQSQESLDKMVKTRKEKGIGVGESNPMWRSGERGIHYMLGKTHSEQTKSKISESLMGNIPWNKGLKTVKADEQLQKEKLNLFLNNKIKTPIKVTNLDDGTILYFPTKKDCEKYYNFDIRYRLKVYKLETEQLCFERITTEDYVKNTARK